MGTSGFCTVKSILFQLPQPDDRRLRFAKSFTGEATFESVSVSWFFEKKNLLKSFIFPHISFNLQLEFCFLL